MKAEGDFYSLSTVIVFDGTRYEFCGGGGGGGGDGGRGRGGKVINMWLFLEVGTEKKRRGRQR